MSHKGTTQILNQIERTEYFENFTWTNFLDGNIRSKVRVPLNFHDNFSELF